MRPDLTLGAFALMVVIGGSNIVAVRFSNQELPPFWGATLRFAGAAAVFFAIVALRRIRLPRGRALWGPLLYGVFGGGASYALAYWALTQVNAGVAAVVLALVPLMTFFLAIAHRLEFFSGRGLIGALVAAAGIGLIFRDQLALNVPLAPLIALLAATACIAESAIVVKFFPRVDGFATNAIGALVTVAMMLPLSFLAGEPRALPTLGATWIALTYLVVIGSVVLFFLFLHILERWTASATSYALVLSPLVTITVAAALAGETVTAAFLAGGALVGLGVYLGAIGRPGAGTLSRAAAEPAA
jgi:drug/metabolite transporter (DMT)-like permease